MKILVTGGYGFIGRNLIKLLLKAPGNIVTCIDDLSAGSDLIAEEYISVQFRFILDKTVFSNQGVVSKVNSRDLIRVPDGENFCLCNSQCLQITFDTTS